jgi:RNA polymerase sigma factor (sigma-70 family)
MSRPYLHAAVKRLCAAASRSTIDDRTDRELLDRFESEHDEAAFAAVVRRHGPMVFATCQRVLRHNADAEDAFQATFLVLARKPRTVRSGASAGPWLYAVALRLAGKLQSEACRRRERERVVAVQPTAAAPDATLREIEAVLDEELAALPTRLRSPLVLCYLQTRTQDEAAREMGWSVRTLRRRLNEGRRRLHDRLVRRGFSLPAALLAAGLARSETTAAAPAIAASTAAAARTFAAGGAAGVSARVVALARTGIGSSVVSRWPAVAALAVVLGGVAGASAFALHANADSQGRSDDVGEAKEAGAGKPAPAAARDAFGDLLPERAVARLGTVRFNHGQGLGALFFSPDGKTVLSRGGGVIRAWNAGTGEELYHLSEPPGFWTDQEAAFSPDGKQFLTLHQGLGSDTLRFLDLVARKEVKNLSLPIERPNSFSAYRRNAVSPDGRRCLTYSQVDVRVFDTATGTQLCKLPKTGEDVQAVTFAGNDRVVTADKEHNIDVWEAATGKSVRRFNAGSPVGTATASADGRWLVTLDHHINPIDTNPQNDVASLWDLATGLKRGSLPAGPKRWFMQVRLSPDGRHVHAAIYGSNGVYEWQVWDTEDPRRGRAFNTIGFAHLAISADGNTLVEGSDYGKFEVWDFRSGRRLSCGDGREAQVRAVSLVGDRVVTAGDGSAALWSGVTGRRLRGFDLPRFPVSYPTRCLSADGRLVVSYDGNLEERRAVVLDVDTGRRLYASQADAPSAFSSDLFASWHPEARGQGGVVRIREARTGKEIRTFPAKNANWPGQLSFTADGKMLFVAGRRIVAYEVATGRELFSWRLPPPGDNGGFGVMAVGGPPTAPEDRTWWRAQTVSPSGTLAAFILVGGEIQGRPLSNRLVLADATTGQVLRCWSDSGSASSMWENLEFSPDGRQLASSDRMTVHLWEVATGKEIRTLHGHRGEIAALAFSADARRLATAGYESTTLLWDLTAGPKRADATDKEVAAWWVALAGEDAARADEAAWRLADVPVLSVAVLRRHLRPVTTADIDAARARIAELDSETFAVREKATAELERLGLNVVPLLKRSLGDGPSPEAKRRISELLEKLGPFPSAGEPLRTWRALTVLERAGTAEARCLLETLAGGEPDAWLTRESAAALRRMGKSTGANP